MALVEVVSGLATDKAVAAPLFDTAAAWGKTPVHTRSTPGFIVNRVARSYYGEAMRLLGEGAADVATIDAVMREAGGFKMGPFELTDMIGHDVNFAVSRSVWNAFFNDPRFLPSLIQQELVDAGFYGRKSGRGFYDYREGAERPRPSRPSPSRCRPIVLHGHSPAVEAIADRLYERAWPTPGARQRRADRRGRRGGLPDRWPQRHPARRRNRHRQHRADRPGPRLHPGHPAGGERRPQLLCAGCGAAIGLLQAAGFAVSRFADVPGWR
jgi:3-hydroxybutyryl-CoA dehydrogenase